MDDQYFYCVENSQPTATGCVESNESAMARRIYELAMAQSIAHLVQELTPHHTETIRNAAWAAAKAWYERSEYVRT